MWLALFVQLLLRSPLLLCSLDAMRCRRDGARAMPGHAMPSQARACLALSPWRPSHRAIQQATRLQSPPVHQQPRTPLALPPPAPLATVAVTFSPLRDPGVWFCKGYNIAR